MKLKNVLLVYQFRNCGAHKTAKEVLSRNRIRFKSLNRTRMNPRIPARFDLVITIGGDGTFLRTSHFIMDKTPVLGMNADPENKVGFFTQCDETNFEQKFKKIICSSHRIVRLSRLQCDLNGHTLPNLALNEFFVSHSIPYKMSRYWIDGEYQRSSGVLIGTAAGSYAWMRSAGGKRLPLSSERFQFVVREIYVGLDCCPKKKKGILAPDKRITIVSGMRHGIIVVDSLSKAFSLKKGDTAVFSQSKKYLNMVSLKF